MRQFFTSASFAGLAVLGATMVAAQTGAEAATTARSYDLAGFDEISVIGPHHVTVSVGPAFSVRAEGPRQTLADTEVEIEDGRLKIHPVDDEEYWDRRCGERQRSDRRWRCWDDYQPATFHVTLPRIEAASLAGGGDMRIDRVEGANFAASVAGSGGLDVATLRVDDARFSIAGSGDLVARGSARRSRVSIAGSGTLQAREVTSDEATISIAGSGDVALTVRDDARVSIVGGGDVEISGPARCSVSRFGGGRVRCNGESVAG
jgi:hypothetical protein